MLTIMLKKKNVEDKHTKKKKQTNAVKNRHTKLKLEISLTWERTLYLPSEEGKV